jgi:hypothetical protein
MKQQLIIMRQANRFIDILNRKLLVQILSEEKIKPTHLRLREARSNLVDMLESGVAFVSDTYGYTKDWTERAKFRRQQVQNIHDNLKLFEKEAKNLINKLPSEYLLSYFLDYQRKGHQYAFDKWIGKVPKEKLMEKEDATEIIRVPVKIVKKSNEENK